MTQVFVDMALDDEDMADMAVPCETAPNKKLMPEYPWGLRLSLCDRELEKLKLDPEQAVVGGMIHLHAMARITSVSMDQRADGSEHSRVEFQVEQLAVESEDQENEDADDAVDVKSRKDRRRKAMYG